MVKIFVIGDIHIGKKYDRYDRGDLKNKLVNARFECIERAVKRAEEEGCEFFAITGDLFDRINGISKNDVRRAAEAISKFNGTAIVLPGNHDYYTGTEKVWLDFREALSSIDNNVILLTEMKPLKLETADETITFYPAFCDSKYSEGNNLEWIKHTEFDDSTYHIGISHGSIEGISPDLKNEYFLMTKNELESIPVDAWFIGHTHIPYPPELKEDEYAKGYKIYNAGTPAQTDLSNNTPGCCFIIKLEKAGGATEVLAKKYISGEIRFFDLEVKAAGDNLKRVLEEAVRELPHKSIVRVKISGAIAEEDYLRRADIYDEVGAAFLDFEVVDTELSELITDEKIRTEFAEIGFAAKFLMALEDSKEKQLAYEIIKRYQK